METNSARCLINSISRFILLVSSQKSKSLPAQKDFMTMAVLMKHFKPYLDEVVDEKIIPDENLLKECEKLDIDINEAREYVERWSPKASRILSVWHSELVLTRIRSSSLEICGIIRILLRALPSSSTLTGVQVCTDLMNFIEELQNWEPNRISMGFEQALRNQSDNSISPTENLIEIIESLGLLSNQELVKERISIENEKIKAKALQIKGEAVDQIFRATDLISLIQDYMLKSGYFDSCHGFSQDIIHTDSFRGSHHSSNSTSRSSSVGHSREIQKASCIEHSHTHVRTQSASSTISVHDYSSKSITEMSESQNSNYLDMGSDETTTCSFVEKLVADLKTESVEVQSSAAYEIRLLAKHNMENRVIIGKSGAIDLLVGLMYSDMKIVQEHSVTAILNLSINEANKAMIAKAGAIESLIHVLKSGNNTAKENSAATLFSLAVVEEYKVKIGRSGAIRALVNLLGMETVRGKKDSISALFNLSICHENKARIVQAGAVRYLVELLEQDSGLVDKAIALLANLATVSEGRSAIVRQGGIPMVVEILDCGSQRGKENAAFTLLQLCLNNDKFCSMVLQEGAVPPLVALSQTGTPRAREKAQQLLSHFRSQRETATNGKKKIK